MTGVVEIFVGMMIAVVVLALVARKLHIPYPIFFVIGGTLISFIPRLPRAHLNPDLIFLFILPPLLFPAALFTSWRDFRANRRPIGFLAVGLVLFTTVIVAWIAHVAFHLPWAAGFVLGAIISPPDAIAATAIAERLKIPRRIVTIIEGESLVNDATALVAYRFGVLAVVSGTFSLANATGQFFFVSIGGIALGLLIGWLAEQFHRRINDAPIEITVSLLTPFAAFLLAQRLEVSGVLAVVTAGLYLGWRTPIILSYQTRLRGGPVWEMIEFLLNGFVFLLIGLELPEVWQNLSDDHIPVSQLIWYSLLITVAVIVIRILWVIPAAYLPRLLFKSIRKKDPYPRWEHVAIIGWTGMRGVVSLAAALALPEKRADGTPFPGRDLILFLTFVIILATLVVQGLSLPPLIRWLGVQDDGVVDKEEREARLKANQAALARLREVTEPEEGACENALKRLMEEYEDHIQQIEAVEKESEKGDLPLRLFSNEYERLSHQALEVERRTIIQLRNDSVISDEVLRRIQRDIDLAEARLRQHA